MYDLLIVNCLTSRSKILHSYNDVTVIGEEEQSNVHVVFDHGGFLNASHLLLHRILVFAVSSNGQDHLFAL